jgi:hypothetical protein
MCLQHSAVRPYQKWNWAGNEIVQNTALKLNRIVLRKGTRISKYEIDIREFISIENNAVIGKLLKSLVHKLPPDEQARFVNTDFGNRDFRVRCCQEYLKHFTYSRARGSYDTWQYPEETIVLKSGDCEDFAFLLAAMIEGCGISPYCLRVALGTVTDYTSRKPSSWDHAWVAYQNEYGAWQIIEPVQYVKHDKTGAARAASSARQLQDVEYVPHYVFNRSHLWRVRSNDPVIRKDFQTYVAERDYFRKFHPSFAAAVHNDIFDQALGNLSWFTRQRIKAVSLYVDVNTATYDPRDHFDFAYIDQSWALVQKRLSSGTLTDFALATHGIADFYAHTLYGYFMLDPVTGTLPVYDPAHPTPDASKLVYDFSGLGPLPGCTSDVNTAAQYWTAQKQIISGQWYRWYASIPNSLQKSADFPMRRCLPDHDALAVDSPTHATSHKLFKTKDEFQTQFAARRAVAIAHIKAAYAAGNYEW